jgi:hypothetical protein
LEAYWSIIVSNEAIVNQGKVVRPSQLIASVRLTTGDGEERDVPTDPGLQNQWLTASAAIYALE